MTEKLEDYMGENADRARDQFVEMRRTCPLALEAIGRLGGITQSNYRPDPEDHARQAGFRDMALTIFTFAGIDLMADLHTTKQETENARTGTNPDTDAGTNTNADTGTDSYA